MFDIEKIANDWEIESKLYDKLGIEVSKFIKKEITNYEILPEVTHRTKDLLSIIKKIRKNLKVKDYGLNDLKDKLGVRIICAFSSDLEIVDKFLKENFIVEKADYKKNALEFDKLDYTSNHYDVKLDTKNKKHSFEKDIFKDLVFEIQVRTINQHAWSNSAHTLTYKREASISDALKRRVYRLLSLYEIADDEFSSVNFKLSNQKNNLSYSLLRKLENKIYKYAGVDFDRDTSLYYLNKILDSFEEKQKKIVNDEIDSFIKKHDKKISNIFHTNKVRYYKIPFITQPEVFIVWFALEKFPFRIEEIYMNEFDIDELEQIKALWG